jgi:hypothetical protein
MGSRGWKKSKDCLSRKKNMDAAGFEPVTSR